MIPAWILALLVGGVAGGLIVAYWDEIVDWVTKFFNAFQEWFAKHFPRLTKYVKVFINKLKGDRAKIKCNSYYQENEQWFTSEGVREIPASEVPPDIRAQAKATRKEADITLPVLGRTM